MSGHLVRSWHTRSARCERALFFVRTFLTNTLSREFLQTPPKHRKRPKHGQKHSPRTQKLLFKPNCSGHVTLCHLPWTGLSGRRLYPRLSTRCSSAWAGPIAPLCMARPQARLVSLWPSSRHLCARRAPSSLPKAMHASASSLGCMVTHHKSPPHARRQPHNTHNTQ